MFIVAIMFVIVVGTAVLVLRGVTVRVCQRQNASVIGERCLICMLDAGSSGIVVMREAGKELQHQGEQP